MKRVTAIALVLIFFAGIPGLTTAAHYCGNEMVETQWMLGPSELGCGMDNMADDCPSTGPVGNLHAEDCCQNHYLTLEVSDAYELAADIIVPNFHFNAVLVYVVSVIRLRSDIDAPATIRPRPPSLPLLDYNILYEVFRL